MKDTIFPIDTATGEVVQGITMIDADGWRQIADRKKRQESSDIRRMDHGVLGKFYLTTCHDKQFSSLSSQDVTRLIYLASYLNYKNILMLNERRAMTLTDIPSVLRVSPSTAKRFWDKVNGLYICQNDDQTLMINDCFFRGKQKHIKERLTKFYINAIRNLYESTPTSKHSCLGRIFELLAYINTEYNILCHNPEEADLSKVIPMTLRQFCEATGYDVSKAHRLAQDLSAITFDVDGEQRHFVAFVTTDATSNDRLIVVNPRIIYGGHNYERVEAFALFFK